MRTQRETDLEEEIERLTARLIAESGEVEDLVNRLQESEDDNGRLMKHIAKLEADATCWTHGMNKEGTTGGMYLKANCPDCTAHIAKMEAQRESTEAPRSISRGQETSELQIHFKKPAEAGKVEKGTVRPLRG